MAEYYCHECSIKRGFLNNEIRDFNPTGSTYQLEKFYKHTVPPKCSGTISVFDMPENQRYKDYIVNTLASGCVEFDDQGRKNVIWVAGRTQGYIFKDGVIQGDADGVKEVLTEDSEKIHAFPTGSAQLSKEKCVDCGRDIVH